MRIYLRLLKYGRKYWYILLVGFIASLLYVFFNSFSMWMTASLINTILSPDMKNTTTITRETTPGKTDLNSRLKQITRQIIIQKNPRETLSRLCLILLFSFLLKNIFFYFKNIAIGYVQLRIITDLRNKLYSHLHDLSISFFEKKRSGEIVSIMTNDINNIRHSFAIGFNQLIVEPINILVFISVLFIISWKLTLLSLLLVPVTAFFIVKIGQSVRRKTRRSSKQIAGIVSLLNETISGMRVVKAFNTEEHERNRFYRETGKFFRLVFRQRRLRAVSSPVTESLGVIMGVILLWFGGLEVISGKGMEPEDFIRFIIMLFAILGPARKLSNISMEIQTGIASAQRVFELLDTKPLVVEKPDAIEKRDFKESIVYRNVSFRYSQNGELVLKNINFTVKKGSIVAFVGHSGAGKTTLLDLLPRFYDPIEGAILIDGIDIRDLKLKSLRSLLGIVTQETILFNDTVRNNIAYGQDKVSGEKLLEVIKAANAYEFIQSLPHGLDTIIGEKGVMLSGGQKQRIAIARALLKNPPILILDEATSSLDTESEQIVQAAIDSLMKERTVLVIAHRLSTIVNAHKIIVLDHGTIIETGTHQELIDKKGKYFQLYQHQFTRLNAQTGNNKL